MKILKKEELLSKIIGEETKITNEGFVIVAIPKEILGKEKNNLNELEEEFSKSLNGEIPEKKETFLIQTEVLKSSAENIKKGDTVYVLPNVYRSIYENEDKTFVIINKQSILFIEKI